MTVIVAQRKAAARLGADGLWTEVQHLNIVSSGEEEEEAVSLRVILPWSRGRAGVFDALSVASVLKMRRSSHHAGRKRTELVYAGVQACVPAQGLKPPAPPPGSQRDDVVVGQRRVDNGARQPEAVRHFGWVLRGLLRMTYSAEKGTSAPHRVVAETEMRLSQRLA
jgi:hypothetical protein